MRYYQFDDPFINKQPPKTFIKDLSRPMHQGTPNGWNKREKAEDEIFVDALVLDFSFPDPEGLLDTIYTDFKEFMVCSKIKESETGIKLSTKFDTEYDVILMSNIFEYLYTDTTDIASRLKVFHANVLTPIAENILSKDGGKACFHYSWNTNVELWNQGLKSFERHTQYSIDSFNETKYSFDAIGVKSICSLAPNGQDAMLYMTQNQR